jgi:hypothetical protein
MTAVPDFRPFPRTGCFGASGDTLKPSSGPIRPDVAPLGKPPPIQFHLAEQGKDMHTQLKMWPIVCCLAAVTIIGCKAPENPRPFAEWLPKDGRVNKDGCEPWDERTFPLRRIADEANAESDVPAIKAAAEIKQQEDLAPQKIKAIRYLATIGCGCYDADGKVTDALLAAMDDCTEEVRLITIETIHCMALQGACQYCEQANCCSKEIVEKLSDIAYEYKDDGSPVEPSKRVRDAAAAAMLACCPAKAMAPIEPQQVDPETEQPEVEQFRPEESPENDADKPEASSRQDDFLSIPPVPPQVRFEDGWEGATEPVFVMDLRSDADEGGLAPANENAEEVADEAEELSGEADAEADLEDRSAKADRTVIHSEARTTVVQPAARTTPHPEKEAASPATPSRRESATVSVRPQRSASAPPLMGTVQDVDASGNVHIRFSGADLPFVGERMMVYHRFTMGRVGSVGQLEVISTGNGAVVAKPVAGLNLNKVATGDSAVLIK